MKAFGRQVLATVAVLGTVALASGCGEDDTKGNHQIWFMGSIYDGATGAIVTGYDISLTYGPTTIKGTVDANGRYTLGPLKAWNDYAVTISHPDYRAFTSYNSGIAPPARPVSASSGSNTQTTNITADDIYSANTTQTFDFDAYLFPNAVQAAALTVSIVKTDATPPPPDGDIRLRPTTLPSIQDQASGVAGQVWANDRDMLAEVFSSAFTSGTITIDAGVLVYGVTYAVTVYNVPGYQTGTANIKAGFQDSQIVNIASAASPLVIVSNTISQCRPAGQSTNVITAAQVSFTFNTSAFEDVTPVANGRGAEALDDGLIVATTMNAILKSDLSTTMQEHGTTFNLSANDKTLSFAWNPSAGLNTPSPSDTIVSVTYGNLSSIRLQPIGHPELVTTLQALLNMSSIFCGN